MYSLMSIWMSASSSPNMNSASALASNVLPTPRGPEEQEAADRPMRIFQTAAAAADRLADRLDRLVLADDALVQLVLHLEQAQRSRLSPSVSAARRSSC